MDVDPEASLRFGGRRMLLREILELDAGSVVELDCQVQQPADLLLDGKLIARGEVVVVGGHYGSVTPDFFLGGSRCEARVTIVGSVPLRGQNAG